jgi:hypothetical protein
MLECTLSLLQLAHVWKSTVDACLIESNDNTSNQPADSSNDNTSNQPADSSSAITRNMTWLAGWLDDIAAVTENGMLANLVIATTCRLT